MPTERTPLREGEMNVPPYVFITNNHRSYKNKVRKFQCCMCAAILAVFITALVITVSYTVNQDYEDSNLTETAVTDLPPSTDARLNTLLAMEWPLKEKGYPKWNEPPNDTEIESAIAEGRKSLAAKETFEEKTPTLLLSSPSFRHQMATKTLPKARQLSKTGHIMEAATKYLVKRRTKSGKNIGRGPTLHVEWLPQEVCSKESPSICSSSPYRTADGTCNNLIHPRTWGVAMRPFRRILPPDYADGISAPRKGKDGNHLPSARDVSITVHRPFYRDDPNFTVMLAVWGQFIDHDITATALSQGKNGDSISCCNGHYQAGLVNHPECYTVSLAAPDPYYEKNNVSCMEFVRAAPAPMCSFGPREQLNQATSFLDGSVVYGTTDALMNQLRTFQGGELKMLVTPDGMELLPVSTDANDGCNQDEELKKGRYCFLSGDPRSNENIHLTSMHLLLARQHNMIVRKLAEVNPSWNDEKLFQEGRKIMSAQMQHITYNEFVSVILGPRLMEKVKMSPRKEGEYYKTYDPSLDPSIANSFASSAFRFGHTLLPGLVRMIAGDTSTPEYVEMHKMLFNPFQLYDKGFLEKAVRGVVNTPVEKVDTYFNKEFTERLFERKSSVGQKGICGLDLVSLNVQRGRDHGLPGYAEWREHCGLKKPTTFEDLNGELDQGSLDRIKQIYKSVDDIDMYTGALAEVPLEGSLVGPTVTCILTDQFLRLQRGDRYWYETSEQPQAFTPAQLKTIRETTLAKIICDTSGMEELQPYVMRGVSADNNRTSCSQLPSLDFTAWKEPAKVTVEPAGKIWLIKSTAPKAPSVIRLGGIVTSGGVNAEGISVWSGSLPLRIPVKPLDGVATTTDVDDLPYPPVFSHGILWSGSVTASAGKARVDGRFSLPRYVHGPEGTTIQWYNGGVSLDIQLEWNSTNDDSIALQDDFNAPLYFSSRWQFADLKNASVTDISPVSAPSLSPEISSNYNVSPIVLLGTFSDDGSYFLWSGNVTIVLPTPPPKIPEIEPTLKLAYTPKSYVKRLQIGAAVTGGSIRVQGSTIWSGNLPLAIPVDPFDTVADASSSVDGLAPYYGHGINWKGSVLSNGPKTATLSGTFSLPRFVHSDGITPFSIQWYNGDLSIDLDILWSSSVDPVISIDGMYTSSVYFGERWQYSSLKNSSLGTFSNLNLPYSGTPSQLNTGLNSPIVLLGSYADDRKTFLWSGNVTLVLPQVVKLPDQISPTTLIKNKAASNVAKVRVPMRLVGGQVNIGAWNVWYNNLPVAFPFKPFDSVASVDSDLVEPEDRPIVYGHGILWSGSATTIDSNYVKLKGSFSFPQFVHSNGLTNNLSLSWSNGDFDLQFQVNKTFALNGTFTTSVYYAERPTFETLRESSAAGFSSLRGLGIENTMIPKILDGDPEDYTTAPLILFGAYSIDRTQFLWSGDCILVAPKSSAGPAVVLTASAPQVAGASLKLGGDSSSQESPPTIMENKSAANGPKIRVPLRLVGGQVNMGAWNVWYNKLPVAFPIKPFDLVASPSNDLAEPEDRPLVYGHGILWSGSASMIDSNNVKLTGSFSFPQYLHSNGLTNNFSLSWLNGDFDLQFQVNKTFPISGTFTTAVYYAERPAFEILRNSSVNSISSLRGLGIENTALPKILNGNPEDYTTAPLILFGAYSLDRMQFLWSGDCILVAPQASARPAIVLKSSAPQTSGANLQDANGSSQKSPTTIMNQLAAIGPKIRVPLRLVGGRVNMGAWNVWYNNLPVAFPIKPFDLVASPSNDLEEPEDRPLVYGHGILWSGSAAMIDSKNVKLTGSFSFPQYLHSNGLTNNFSISWLNGDFDLQFQVNKTFHLNGTFTTAVYYAERYAFETLRNSSVSSISSLRGLGIESTNVPKTLDGNPEDYTTAPLILFGAYSLDRTQFLWSGDCLLVAPETSATPAIVLQASGPKEATTGLRFGGDVISAIVYVGDDKVSVEKPPLTLSTALFGSVSTASSTANQPPSFGQDILWSGRLTDDPKSPKTVILNGTFSLPTVENNVTSWYNGNFSFVIDVIWRTSNGSLAGSFASPIFFQNRMNSTKDTKLVSSSEDFYNTSSMPSVSPVTQGSAPIILTGTLSEDKLSFSWTGGITVILPVTPTLMLAEPPVTDVSRLSVAAFVAGGSIKLGTSTVWVGNRVPLNIPTKPFDTVVSDYDDSINSIPTYGHGISWKGFISSDSPGTMKVWGTYSLPHFLHSNETKNFNIEWYNGDFAFQLSLLWDTTTNININGTYATKIYLQEHTFTPPLTGAWDLTPADIPAVATPNISPNETTAFAPLILWGNYSPDRSTFICSGNVTLIVATN